MGNNSNEVRYTYNAIQKGDKAPGIHGHIKGFVTANKNNECLAVRTVNTANGPQKVANIFVRAIVPDSTVKYIAGEEAVNPQYHTMAFRLAAWGRLAELLEKFTFEPKSLIGCTFYGGKVSSYDGKNGPVYMIEATLAGVPEFPPRKSSGGNTSAATNRQPVVPSASKPVAYSNGSGYAADDFADIEDDEGDLPF